MIDYLRVNKINNFTVYCYFIFTNILLSILFMNLVVAVLVYHYEDSRQKQRFKELSNIILTHTGESSVLCIIASFPKNIFTTSLHPREVLDI